MGARYSAARTVAPRDLVDRAIRTTVSEGHDAARALFGKLARRKHRDTVIESTCHCGAVALEIARIPVEVTECNCSICRRYGVLWAYFELAHVKLPAAGTTEIYMWDDRSIEFHRCRVCGCVTHWYPCDPARNRMGINARLLPLGTLKDVRVRHLDGAVSERYID